MTNIPSICRDVVIPLEAAGIDVGVCAADASLAVAVTQKKAFVVRNRGIESVRDLGFAAAAVSVHPDGRHVAVAGDVRNFFFFFLLLGGKGGKTLLFLGTIFVFGSITLTPCLVFSRTRRCTFIPSQDCRMVPQSNCGEKAFVLVFLLK